MERRAALSETKGLVSIILVTWNSARFLRRCLEAILAQTYAHVELIGVDNGSFDGSADVVAHFAERMIRNGSNRGFSVAVNQGIAVAHGEYVLLVNPDCRLSPDYVARLVAALEESGEEFGSATGLLMKATGAEMQPADGVDSAGIRMTRSGRHLDIDEQPAERTEVFGVSGAAAMYRRSFLHSVEVHGAAFDEDFFAYREDADIAWRGRVLGWRALCEPAALAWHVRTVTPEARRYLPRDINMHSVKNRFLLRMKNEGRYLALRNAPFELSRDLVVFFAALLIEQSSLPAFVWLWKNRKRVLSKRHSIQRRRRVSDRELAEWFG